MAGGTEKSQHSRPCWAALRHAIGAWRMTGGTWGEWENKAPYRLPEHERDKGNKHDTKKYIAAFVLRLKKGLLIWRTWMEEIELWKPRARVNTCMGRQNTILKGRERERAREREAYHLAEVPLECCLPSHRSMESFLYLQHRPYFFIRVVLFVFCCTNGKLLQP